jgi:hypothetical protein
MLMPKVGKGCAFEDAVELAKYEGLRPDPPEKRTRTIGSLTARWRPDCNYRRGVLHEQSSIKFFAAGTCQV